MTHPDVELPAGLLASLEVCRPPFAILIRHSDRYAIPEGDEGFSTPLTPLGEARAQALGERLGPLQWGLSSPLLRCVTTATLAGIQPQASHLLGDPGPFVIHSQRGGEVFGAHSTEAVVRAQLEGETWGCLRPLEEGARMLSELLCARLHPDAGVGLAVSHDAIVMPFIRWATGETFTGTWLAPLDGIVICPDAVIWQGQRHARIP